ncbi:MAG: hypothetical protein IJF65_06545 [Clostridia bacterium]|nr:hypothetical protein [Clostridia bacterium]
MKNNRRIIAYGLLFVLGAMLLILNHTGRVEDFWGGAGSGLLLVGLLRGLQTLRLHKDEAYREKMTVEAKDERNRFLRGQAWAWAGYLFILITGAGVILLRVTGQPLMSQAASYALCLMLILYWSAYWILRKKY